MRELINACLSQAQCLISGLALAWCSAASAQTAPLAPSANPYDALGRWHNCLLFTLVNDHSAVPLQWTQLGMVQSGISVPTIAADERASLSWQVCYSALPYQVENSADRQKVYRLLRLSTAAEQHLEALFAPETPADEVPTLEQLALGDTRLSASERVMVLASYSIARHSAVFWAAHLVQAVEPQDTPRKKVKRESYIELSDEGLKRKRRKTDEVDILEVPDSLQTLPYSLYRNSSDTLSPGTALVQRKLQPLPTNKLLKADAFGLLKGVVSGGVLFGLGNLLLNVRETPLVVSLSGALLVAPAVDSARYHHKWKRQQITENSVESIY